MEDIRKRVVSMVLLLRCDPAPEWPVYQRPDSLYHSKEKDILSLFKSGHVWASFKDIRIAKKERGAPYVIHPMFYNASYVMGSKTVRHQ